LYICLQRQSAGIREALDEGDSADRYYV